MTGVGGTANRITSPRGSEKGSQGRYFQAMALRRVTSRMRDKIPQVVGFKGEHHKPSYRPVTPLDARDRLRLHASEKRHQVRR